MKRKWIMLVALVAVISLAPGLANAIDLFKDDFEGWDLGQVGGQGSWGSYSGGANAVVVSSPVYAGSQALDLKFSTHTYRRGREFGQVMTDTSCNVLTYYFRMGGHWGYQPTYPPPPNLGDGYFNFFWEGEIEYPICPTLIQIQVYDSGVLLYMDPTSGSTVNTTKVLANDTWYKFTYEYKPTLGTVRWKIDPAAGGANVLDVTVTGAPTDVHGIFELRWQDGKWSPAYDYGFHIYLDDVSIGPFAGVLPGSLSGQVIIDDYTPPAEFAGIPVGVHIELQGTANQSTYDIPLDVDMYYLTNVPPDIYTVSIKAPWTKETVLTDVEVPNGGAGLAPTAYLTNGDVDGDNGITTTDLSVVLKNLQ